MNLTLVATNGTELVLNSTDIGSLSSYRAFGGYKNQLGNIRGLGNYTGVPLTTLCTLVGGINTSDILRVSASDAYNINFTYDQVKNGDFIAYDPATGDQVSHLQPLIPIIAYCKNDTNLSPSEGPLRLAIVGPEGFVTNSTYWVKWVVKLEIITAGVPEFPSQIIVILFMTMTLFASVAYRKSQSLKSIAPRINRKTSSRCL
jgi:hypothetical protein